MAEHINRDKGRYVKIIEEKEYGVATGFRSLDKMLYGLHPGLHLIAARPSVGKTSLAMNAAVNIATAKKKVLFFSIEMNKPSFMERLVGMKLGISPRSIRDKSVSEDDKENLSDADDLISGMDLYVDYASQHSPASLRKEICRLGEEENFVPDVVLVDYIQYMKTDQGGMANSHQNLSEISRGLVQLTKDLNLPFVVIAQLNRGADEYASAGDKKNWTPKAPRLSDLKGSGSLEEDSDVVILLHRTDYYKEREDKDFKPEESDLANAMMIVAKNRQGPCGSFNLTWLPEIFKFTELSL